MKKMNIFATILTAAMLLTACQSGGEVVSENMPSNTLPQESTAVTQPAVESESTQDEAPVLLYMGQATLRITTAEGKVIYIDPYAGDEDDYAPPADLILVTHDHFDHTAVDRVVNRSEDCQIITHEEAIENGEHITFDLGFVTVQPVEAGYNSMHDVRNCVGYVLTFSNGKSVYVTGDTSKTEQMSEMAAMNIDYAFYCTDGVFNMDIEEAAECAELIGAKHNIPYHNDTSNSGEMFDMELAEQFDAPNRLIVAPGEEIRVE
ncbi:MBL fold metallo-hydrolase [Dysosmobacter welbionis]|uniref:MBL fold metallo-hydrolase n=1 Tax=Dysosmobacter welbionis TaxID=2093857 RepID=UPI0032C07904